MLDPVSAMYAAAENVASGKVEEIELTWTRDDEDDIYTSLTIVVRKTIKTFSFD